MHEFELSEKLQKILKKLLKKDNKRYEILMKKIEEICSNENIEHYKNLSNEMKEFKRVHLDSHFVLTFKHIKKTDLNRFEDFQHHDVIYRKKQSN
ncbi:MAG: addiction module toxin RelE [archaeon]|nr:addiction module toxin RelE [archaeon]